LIDLLLAIWQRFKSTWCFINKLS